MTIRRPARLKAKLLKVRKRRLPDYSSVVGLMGRGIGIKARRPRQTLAEAAKGWQLDARRFASDLTASLKERRATYSSAAREMGLTEATVRRYASGRGITSSGVRVPALVVISEMDGPAARGVRDARRRASSRSVVREKLVEPSTLAARAHDLGRSRSGNFWLALSHF